MSECSIFLCSHYLVVKSIDLLVLLLTYVIVVITRIAEFINNVF